MQRSMRLRLPSLLLALSLTCDCVALPFAGGVEYGKSGGKLHCIAFVAAIMGEHFPKGEDGEDARPPDYWLAQFEAKAKRVHNGNLSNGAKYADISLFTQTSHRNSDPCSQMENLERSK